MSFGDRKTPLPAMLRPAAQQARAVPQRLRIPTTPGSGFATTADGGRFIRSIGNGSSCAASSPSSPPKFGICTRSAKATPTGSRSRMWSAGDDQSQVSAGVREAAPDGRGRAPDAVEPRCSARSDDQPLVITEGEWDALIGDPGGVPSLRVGPQRSAQQDRTDNLSGSEAIRVPVALKGLARQG
jgi:hypothetical protein